VFELCTRTAHLYINWKHPLHSKKISLYKYRLKLAGSCQIETHEFSSQKLSWKRAYLEVSSVGTYHNSLLTVSPPPFDKSFVTILPAYCSLMSRIFSPLLLS
jgi:hypothetical protein